MKICFAVLQVDGLPSLILCSGVLVAAGREPFRKRSYDVQKPSAPTWLPAKSVGRLYPLTSKSTTICPLQIGNISAVFITIHCCGMPSFHFVQCIVNIYIKVYTPLLKVQVFVFITIYNTFNVI